MGKDNMSEKYLAPVEVVKTLNVMRRSYTPFGALKKVHADKQLNIWLHEAAKHDKHTRSMDRLQQAIIDHVCWGIERIVPNEKMVPIQSKLTRHYTGKLIKRQIEGKNHE